MAEGKATDVFKRQSEHEELRKEYNDRVIYVIYPPCETNDNSFGTVHETPLGVDRLGQYHLQYHENNAWETLKAQ